MELNPHVQRMLIERAELNKKVILLKAFMEENPIFGTLSVEEQKDMVDQYKHMVEYKTVLERRIKRAEGGASNGMAN